MSSAATLNEVSQDFLQLKEEQIVSDDELTSISQRLIERNKEAYDVLAR